MKLFHAGLFPVIADIVMFTILSYTKHEYIFRYSSRITKLSNLSQYLPMLANINEHWNLRCCNELTIKVMIMMLISHKIKSVVFDLLVWVHLSKLSFWCHNPLMILIKVAKTSKNLYALVFHLVGPGHLSQLLLLQSSASSFRCRNPLIIPLKVMARRLTLIN